MLKPYCLCIHCAFFYVIFGSIGILVAEATKGISIYSVTVKVSSSKGSRKLLAAAAGEGEMDVGDNLFFFLTIFKICNSVK